MFWQYTKKISNAYFSDFLHLFSPKTCLVCGGLLQEKSKIICFICSNNLPLTEQHQNPYENDLAKIFWGRVNIERHRIYVFQKD